MSIFRNKASHGRPAQSFFFVDPRDSQLSQNNQNKCETLFFFPAFNQCHRYLKLNNKLSLAKQEKLVDSPVVP